MHVLTKSSLRWKSFVRALNRYTLPQNPCKSPSDTAQALSWLEKTYFLPTLAKNAPQAPESTPVAPLLKQYKTLMKSILRDRSLQRSLEGDLNMSLRSFDAWIGEAATAAWSLWDSDAEERGGWALEKLSTALTQSGGLVPVAKKYVGFNLFFTGSRHSRKRPNTFDAPNTDIWTPLLDHIQKNYAEFASILVETIVSAIVSSVDENDAQTKALRGRGYYTCLSGWLLWIISYWSDVPECDAESVTWLLLRGIPREAEIP